MAGHDTLPPPSDLDWPAARAAARHYREAMAQGIGEAAAWAEAVEVFRGFHPPWPLPLAEREAARTVGALLILQAGTLPAPRAVPLDLLLRLAQPRGPEAPSPFRQAWRLAAPFRPSARRLPFVRLAPTTATASKPESARI